MVNDLRDFNFDLHTYVLVFMQMMFRIINNKNTR